MRKNAKLNPQDLIEIVHSVAGSSFNPDPTFSSSSATAEFEKKFSSVLTSVEKSGMD